MDSMEFMDPMEFLDPMDSHGFFFLGPTRVRSEMLWLTDGQWMVNRWPLDGRPRANDWPMVGQ